MTLKKKQAELFSSIAKNKLTKAKLENEQVDLLKGGTGSLPPATNGIVVIDDLDGF